MYRVLTVLFQASAQVLGRSGPLSVLPSRKCEDDRAGLVVRENNCRQGRDTSPPRKGKAVSANDGQQGWVWELRSSHPMINHFFVKLGAGDKSL